MVVLFLAERFDKIFNQDRVLSTRQFLEIVPQIEYILFGNGSTFLR
jgi:hypothetical protein